MSLDYLKFHYRALVYVYGEDDSPEVVHHESMTNSFMRSLSCVDALSQIEDEFETKGLAPGMYEVWIDGTVECTSHNTHEGLDYDQEVHIEKQTWDLASEDVVAFLCQPDVPPVFIFWSSTPVPVPDWKLHGTAKPISGPEDAPPTHNVWTRIDDDKKTLYQVSKVEDKIPTLADGAFYNLHPMMLMKGLILTEV